MLALPALQSKSAVNLEGSWMWPALGRVQRCRSALRVVAKAVLPSIPPYNPHETKETGVPVTIHYMLLGRSAYEPGEGLCRFPGGTLPAEKLAGNCGGYLLTMEFTILITTSCSRRSFPRHRLLVKFAGRSACIARRHKVFVMAKVYYAPVSDS
ncbi:hypothetical protein KC332_g75 [Hortaea werneckii]|nr:hypothetical protein KC332_g75 [Hortaea werneckii]